MFHRSCNRGAQASVSEIERHRGRSLSKIGSAKLCHRRPPTSQAGHGAVHEPRHELPRRRARPPGGQDARPAHRAAARAPASVVAQAAPAGAHEAVRGRRRRRSGTRAAAVGLQRRQARGEARDVWPAAAQLGEGGGEDRDGAERDDGASSALSLSCALQAALRERGRSSCCRGRTGADLHLLALQLLTSAAPARSYHDALRPDLRYLTCVCISVALEPSRSAELTFPPSPSSTASTPGAAGPGSSSPS